MSLGEYLGGTAFLLFELAVIAFAAVRLVRARLPYVTGVDRALAIAMLVSTGVLVSHLIPLCAGILSRWSVAVTAALLAVAAVWLGGREPGPRDEADAAPYPDPQPPESRRFVTAAWVLPVAACMLVAAYLTTVATAAVEHVDFMEFHGPMVANWIQEGSLWEILSLYPTHHNGYDPHNGEVLLLAVALPWRNDFLFRFVDVPFIAVTGAALWSMARHLGAGAGTAVLYAALVVMLPVVVLLGVVTAKPDTVLMATFATGALFLLRHCRSGRPGELAIAALALGLAFGSKWNGITAVAILLACWSVGRIVLGAQRVRVVKETVWVGLATVALGGIWFVRNGVATGNPLFPVKVEVGGVTLLSAPEDRQQDIAGGTLAEFLTDFDAMRDHILPGIYHNMMGPAGILVVVLMLVGAASALRAYLRSPRDAANRAALVIAATAVLIAIAYLFTPYTAQTFNGIPGRAWVNVRYGAPALLLAAPLAAWLTARSGRLRPVLLVAAALALGEAALRSFNGNFADIRVGRVALVTVGAVVLAAIAYAGVRMGSRLDARGRRGLAAAAVAAGLLAAVAVGYVDQEKFNDRRYLRTDPTLAWVQRNAPEDTRIGLVGEWIPVDFSPPLAMYGPRYRNEVVFLGPDRDGIIDEYRSAEALARAVERENVDLVMVQDRPPTGQSDNERWLRGMGFAPVASSPGLVLLRR